MKQERVGKDKKEEIVSDGAVDSQSGQADKSSEKENQPISKNKKRRVKRQVQTNHPVVEASEITSNIRAVAEVQASSLSLAQAEQATVLPLPQRAQPSFLQRLHCPTSAGAVLLIMMMLYALQNQIS